MAQGLVSELWMPAMEPWMLGNQGVQVSLKLFKDSRQLKVKGRLWMLNSAIWAEG